MTATILRLPTPSMHPDAALVERTAKALAVASGDLHASDPFALLTPSLQHTYRRQARYAVAGRDWQDAERFAREYAAQVTTGKCFNYLPPAEQADIAHVVQVVTSAIEVYMDGTAEPLTDWHRERTALAGEIA